MNKLEQALTAAKGNLTIVDALTKADSVINHSGYKNIVVSVSGGADSDIMLDLVERIRDTDAEVHYLWFNTGLEYQATKDHLIELEAKYGIEIERINAPIPVPLGVMKYGAPFLSKRISEDIGRLQAKGFDFTTTDDYATLAKKYPHTTRSLKWWGNYDGEKSRFSIAHRRGLKEFIQANPPTFAISNRCCEGAKKSVVHKYAKRIGADLNLVGVRKAEGGVRATAYKSCIDYKTSHGYAQYRPLFWFTDADKKAYEEIFRVTHSKCYSVYGFKRTGCACCPFGGKNVEKELAATKEYEPRLYKACMKVFGKSYEYTRRFYAFRAEMDTKRGG